MKAYKGFHKDEDGNLVCNGFVFKEGETYTHDGDVKLCNSGFHACEAPLDCFGYYQPSDSEFHEVDLDGVSDEKSNEDTKRVAKSIKVGAKLDIPMLIKAQFEFVKNQIFDENTNSATGSRSANSATGDWSANSATGYGSANISTGQKCKNSGSIATLNAAWGKDSICKGDVGSYLVLSEWGDWNGKKYPLLGAKMVKIDGKRYKADTWYTLKDGKVVKADE